MAGLLDLGFRRQKSSKNRGTRGPWQGEKNSFPQLTPASKDCLLEMHHDFNKKKYTPLEGSPGLLKENLPRDASTQASTHLQQFTLNSASANCFLKFHQQLRDREEVSRVSSGVPTK